MAKVAALADALASRLSPLQKVSAKEAPSVITHEMGHVVDRHAPRSLVRYAGIDRSGLLTFPPRMEQGSQKPRKARRHASTHLPTPERVTRPRGNQRGGSGSGVSSSDWSAPRKICHKQTGKKR